jgi:hypothetical protein
MTSEVTSNVTNETTTDVTNTSITPVDTIPTEIVSTQPVAVNSKPKTTKKSSVKKTKTEPKTEPKKSSKKESKNENKPKGNRGRPAKQILIPDGEFTFEQLCILNGTRNEDGSPIEAPMVPKMCELTLRKFMMDDKKKKGNSLLVVLDKKAESNTKGRKPFLFMKRVRKQNVKSIKSEISMTNNPTPVTA